MRSFHVPYQTRLILGFVGICLLIGLLSLSVGISIINRAVFNETTNRISQDLNAAWEIFLSPLSRSYPVFELAVKDENLRNAVEDFDRGALTATLAANTTNHPHNAGIFPPGVPIIYDVEAFNATGASAKKSVTVTCP